MSNRQPSQALFQFAAYVPTLTGTLSSIGSVAIISHIFVYRNVKLRNPHFRILLGLSVYDLLYSANKALLFLTHPKVQGILGAQGYSTSCALQGFFTHLGYAANCYSSFLGSFFYLTICHGVKSRTFAQRSEPILHVAITVLFMTLASYSVSIGLYNPTGAFCFIAPWPPRCNGNPDVDCERFGDTHSLYYNFSLNYGCKLPMWLFCLPMTRFGTQSDNKRSEWPNTSFLDSYQAERWPRSSLATNIHDKWPFSLFCTWRPFSLVFPSLLSTT